MRPKKNIEEILKNAAIHSHPEVNQAVLRNLLKEMPEAGEQEPALAWSHIIRRIIMKSKTTKLAAAAMILLFAALACLIFGGNGTAKLYAEVIKAMEKVHTLRAVEEKLDEGQWRVFSEYWYDSERGAVWFLMDDYGVKRKEIDDGEHKWIHETEAPLVRRVKSSGDSLGIVANPFQTDNPNVQEIMKRYKVERATEQDRTIDGQHHDAHLFAHKSQTKIQIIWLDEQKHVRGWEKRRRLENGQWETYQRGEVEYEVEVDAKVFIPDFGPNIRIVELDDIFDEYFYPVRTIFTKELSGYVFSIHELKKFTGTNMIYALCSIKDTRGPIYDEDGEAVAAPVRWTEASFNLSLSGQSPDEDGQEQFCERMSLARIPRHNAEWVVYDTHGLTPKEFQYGQFVVHLSTGGERNKYGFEEMEF
jgi:hypothetical protein